jgi:hypothetical protein
VPEIPFVLPLLLPGLFGLLPELPSTPLEALVPLLELELPLEVEVLLVDFDLESASRGDAVRLMVAPASTTVNAGITNVLAMLFMAISLVQSSRMITAAGETASTFRHIPVRRMASQA